MISQINQQSNQKSTQKSPQTEGDLNYNRVEEQTISPLKDADYEFLFNQLLEGVAHGWHPVKITKFFQRLEERGEQHLWTAWLERYKAKISGSSDLYQQQLGARMIRLGEITRSTPSVKEIGTAAYHIGRDLVYGRNSDLIWEYDGSDLPVVSEKTADKTSEKMGEKPVTHQAAQEKHTPTPQKHTPLSPSPESFADAANWIQDAISEFVELAEKVGDRSVIAEVETEHPSKEHSNSETATVSERPQPENQELSVAHTEENPQEKENLVENQSNLVKATNIKPSLLEDANVINLSWQQFTELIEQDDRVVEQVAKHFNLTDKDPQSIIKAINERLNKDESESLNESTLELVESWFNLGLKQASSGDLTEALISWEKALEINPNLAEAWHNRGSALGRLGDYKKALQSFEQALKIDPQNPQAWNDYAHALYQLGQWQGAVASWDRAIDFVPGNYQFWYNRGCALEQLQQNQSAISSYEKALEIKPDFKLARSRYNSLLSGKS